MKTPLQPILLIVLHRLTLGLLTLFLVSVVIFFSVELLPGDYATAILGQSATPETVAAFERQIGLDRPAIVRYVEWVENAVHGDFGNSFSSVPGHERPVATIIRQRLYNTLFLATMTAVVAVPLAVLLGLFSALYRNTWIDKVLNGSTLVTISFPEFFLAYLLTFVVVFRDNFEAAGGANTVIQWLLHLIPAFPTLANVSSTTPFVERLWRCCLPALTLTLAIVAHMMRMTRAAIVNLLASPYIEMARLKGTSPLAIIVNHALRNAWAPIINIIALNLAYLIVGVVVVEVVFVYPGIGQLMVDAVRSRDIPVVQACALIFAATYILFNLCADVITIVTNPRLLHPR